jgi:hypothetical protein
MSDLKLESLNDLLTIEVEKLKSPEKTRLLTRIKHLIKNGNKTEANQDEAAKDLPYEAISVVGNKLVEIKFDLESKKARVINTSSDSRDIKSNYLSGAKAIKKMQEIVKFQKENTNE